MANFPTGTDLPADAATDTSETLQTMCNGQGQGSSFNQVKNGLAQVYSKLGTGASTPTANTVYAGNGTGTAGYTSTPTVTDLTATGKIVPAAVGGTPAQHALYRDNVVKCWGNVSGSTTTINASFNVTSVTDNGASGHTITIDRDFASSAYCILATSEATPGGTTATTYTLTCAIIGAGSFVLYSHRVSDGAHIDTTAYHFACLGAQ